MRSRSRAHVIKWEKANVVNVCNLSGCRCCKCGGHESLLSFGYGSGASLTQRKCKHNLIAFPDAAPVRAGAGSLPAGSTRPHPYRTHACIKHLECMSIWGVHARGWVNLASHPKSCSLHAWERIWIKRISRTPLQAGLDQRIGPRREIRAIPTSSMRKLIQQSSAADHKFRLLSLPSRHGSSINTCF